MKRTIEITEQEIKDLKLIRNYFGEHDKTPLEHLAYSELDKLVKKLQQADVSRRSELLFAFITEIKSEFADQNWDYLDFIAERVIGKQ